MSLRVLTRSPADRLVSLSAIKTELGISVSTYDAKLSRILNAVAFAFAGELGWPLPRQRYEESRSGNSRQRLVLAARPLDGNSVSVVLNDVSLETTDYAIEDAAQAVLWRSVGWPPAYEMVSQPGDENVAITFKAGWVLPEYLSTWTTVDATIANATTKWIRPSSPVLSPYLFEVTTAGTLGVSEPDWSALAAGDTVTDGTAVLTARDAAELPADIYEVAIITARQWYEGALDVPVGVESESADGFRIAYDTAALAEYSRSLPPFACAVLERHK